MSAPSSNEPAMGPDDNRRYLPDPDDMTPEERYQEILDLLAKASVRLAEAQKNGEPETEELPVTKGSGVIAPIRGRIPFGQRRTGSGRAPDKADLECIARIKDLAAAGRSLREIAEHLNREDTRSRYAGRWSRCAVWRILGRAKRNALDFPAKTPLPSSLKGPGRAWRAGREEGRKGQRP